MGFRLTFRLLLLAFFLPLPFLRRSVVSSAGASIMRYLVPQHTDNTTPPPHSPEPRHYPPPLPLNRLIHQPGP
ncbi:hypothetical protein E2C01_094901 [Portunus trituberculatus]|uniref:Secreted protein n=1 Tax=Portunus trituberculatus TaxID=210409 RepID=A0A5B7JYU4_PORTR|nr:hypothetical protein [Portunus trituberculatus]